MTKNNIHWYIFFLTIAKFCLRAVCQRKHIFADRLKQFSLHSYLPAEE